MSYKDKTNNVLLKIYRERGYQYSLDMCKELLKSAYHTKKDMVHAVVGEICETVLEILVLEYIKKNNLKDWFYSKGLILKDIESGNEDFCTELDFVVYSPQRIFLFECKSYKGDKIIVDKGEMKRSGGLKGTDIYSQHKLHTQVFIKIFNAFRKKGYSSSTAYQLAAFSFAEGTLRDLREDKWKTVLPVLEIEGIFPLFDKAKTAPEVWRMKDVRKAVEILEKNKSRNTAKHLDYVSKLHGSKN